MSELLGDKNQWKSFKDKQDYYAEIYTFIQVSDKNRVSRYIRFSFCYQIDTNSFWVNSDEIPIGI